MRDWRYEVLVAVHKLIEMALTRRRNIAEQASSEFDIAFEDSREKALVTREPHDNVNAPYKPEHFLATKLERLFAAELGAGWFE
ncbi:MAG TPA: hypothetical protein VMZ52_05315 [Bryobacteraceae bacterium]|nr:hypothetical protein [Bryobacteraceae bacterium]